MTRILDTIDSISMQYDALFVDLWGCLHNGVTPFDDAVAALDRYKKQGGKVLLLTNSPRPKPAVVEQLDQIGVPREIYDEIASSGDAAQMGLTSGMVGNNVYHVGPERDLGFFENIADDLNLGEKITRVPMKDAEGIVCTGLFDDRTETPDDYRLTILDGVNRGLKMLCANPDIMVDLGDKRIYCAGAIAQAYSEAGGTSLYFGKPHSPIYQLAMKRLEALTGRSEDKNRILCIGDGINTDIRGASAEGMDAIFITGGLAAKSISCSQGKPDKAALNDFLNEHQLATTYAMQHLR